MNAIDWATEFARVVSCTRCDKITCKKILRDTQENVPQPGFVGTRFSETRILLAGQNPGFPNVRLVAEDRKYTAALRRLRDQTSIESFDQLQVVLQKFVPSWPVHGNYFPLRESGLVLDEIAYCNIVRCRTEGNAPPSLRMASECSENHFTRWLDLLKPRAIVFIGKWAHDRGSRFACERRIPCDFMNRERSLSSTNRLENRQRVAAFVRANAGR
jgi:hypothetical protein